MSPCGYGHGVSPCLHVDTDMECLHVSMWIQTWSVLWVTWRSPCGYGCRVYLVSMSVSTWRSPANLLGQGHNSIQFEPFELVHKYC